VLVLLFVMIGSLSFIYCRATQIVDRGQTAKKQNKSL